MKLGITLTIIGGLVVILCLSAYILKPNPIPLGIAVWFGVVPLFFGIKRLRKRQASEKTP